MCGIVGIFGSSADKRDEMMCMLETVRSRGEVDEVYCTRDVCVGTRRLKIVDRERAVQPIFSQDRSKFIIFSGEIFNFRTLKRCLEAKYTFSTDSDTETILHAFEEYGEACVQRLDGQFAFAIYDLEKERLFLARDPLGIVPLYYVHAGGSMYVASIIRALTFLNKPINVLPPGHTLDGRGRLSRYYQPEFGAPAMDETCFVAELKQTIQAAVAKRVDTDLPVGVIYSGGIDSSVVLNEAKR